jgi:hypothetical protein
MVTVKTALNLALASVLSATFYGCKPKDEAPPPLPTPTADPTPTAPPVVSTTAVALQPVAPLPGTAPNSLSEAILVTKPQMKDSTAAPDEGSAGLLKYWLAKMYPWAQLDGTPIVTAAAFLAAPDSARGQRVCSAGQVQQFSKTTTAAPNEYEGTLATKEGEVLSFGAVGDATGIGPNAPARFCGIASGVETLATPDGKQVRAIRVVGYFDTPANRGGGGGGQFASLAACCAALKQNAASMPPPQNMYAAAAAQYCSGMVATASNPAAKDAAIASIRGMLRGVPMPGVCH